MPPVRVVVAPLAILVPDERGQRTCSDGRRVVLDHARGGQRADRGMKPLPAPVRAGLETAQRLVLAFRTGIAVTADAGRDQAASTLPACLRRRYRHDLVDVRPGPVQAVAHLASAGRHDVLVHAGPGRPPGHRHALHVRAVAPPDAGPGDQPGIAPEHRLAAVGAVAVLSAMRLNPDRAVSRPDDPVADTGN